MSKKIILLALAIITVATVFAGCTQKTGNEQTAATQVNIGT